MSQEKSQSHEMKDGEPSLFDAYLDGQLSRSDRAQFEKSLLADVTLAALLRSQQAIEASLRRSFVPPATIAMPTHPTHPVSHSPISRLRMNWRTMPWLRVMAAAASIAVGFGLLARAWMTEFPSTPSFTRRPTMDAVYKSEVSRGFQPGWKCENDKQFADTFRNRLGQPLELKTSPDVQSLGLSYRGVISDNTTYMLAKVGNADVMVFVDRAECGDNQGLAQNSGLHLFTRNMGDLTLYEVTPLDQPKLLDLFYQPGATTQPAGASSKWK
jgi:hypothetical protein